MRTALNGFTFSVVFLPFSLLSGRRRRLPEQRVRVHINISG